MNETTSKSSKARNRNLAEDAVDQLMELIEQLVADKLDAKTRTHIPAVADAKTACDGEAACVEPLPMSVSDAGDHNAAAVTIIDFVSGGDALCALADAKCSDGVLRVVYRRDGTDTFISDGTKYETCRQFVEDSRTTSPTIGKLTILLAKPPEAEKRVLDEIR